MPKNMDHFAVRSQYYGNDSRVHAHPFICMSAIVIAEVLQKRFSTDGICPGKTGDAGSAQ